VSSMAMRIAPSPHQSCRARRARMQQGTCDSRSDRAFPSVPFHSQKSTSVVTVHGSDWVVEIHWVSASTQRAGSLPNAHHRLPQTTSLRLASPWGGHVFRLPSSVFRLPSSVFRPASPVCVFRARARARSASCSPSTHPREHGEDPRRPRNRCALPAPAAPATHRDDLGRPLRAGRR
jgi:hypothetical protein